MSKEKIIVNSTAVDFKNFAKIITVRKGIIASASDAPLQKTSGVNETAAALHPQVQHLVVKRVVRMDKNIKSYVLAPNMNHGTLALAYFKPGQYLSIRLKIGNSVVTRPFSIASSPELAEEGEYIITVKAVEDGYASKFIINNWRVGTQVEASAPQGNFCYEPLRDCENIVGIAGGSGITPFISMAQAIEDGTINCKLTLLYGCRKRSDAVFKDLLDSIAEKCSDFKVIYVFSDERVDGHERGFVSRSVVEKYAPEKFSVFVCGPVSLYKYVASELSLMKLERKQVRFELFGEIKNPTALPGFPESAKDKEYYCTVFRRGDIISEFPCRSDESILTALERAGVAAPSLCRSGECGFCRSKLIQGDIFIPKGTDKRRMADAKYNYIHPCCTYPISDIAIEIN